MSFHYFSTDILNSVSIIVMLYTSITSNLESIPANEISDPTEGEIINENVQIIGTVQHPSFDHYEIHFALDPNTTDTWFPIDTTNTQSVSNNILANWNTNDISDGRYMIRLTIYNDQNTMLSTNTIKNLILNRKQTTSTQNKQLEILNNTTPDPPPIRLIRTSNETYTIRQIFIEQQKKYDYTSTFVSGALYSIMIFITLGGYLKLRRFIRPPIRRWIRQIKTDLRKP